MAIGPRNWILHHKMHHFMLFTLFSSVTLDAYRIGDAVDTIIWTTNTNHGAMRSQMPLFGIEKTATLQRPRTRFSLGFEEGLHALPWTGGDRLEKLIVTFVYSKNSGAIHSVSSQSIERKSGSVGSQVEVEYNWVEEEPVDFHAGASVMFLATLIVSVIFLVRTCIDHDEGESELSYADPASSQWSVHKE
mmetsp:Transcript_13838/g.21808  ORF Transcript_13838/g.21808 Transcript_13838/m.21808 type:complete len:190 (-) Transcript_13838:12-581(-)